jgi:hypothetical protein
MEEFEQHFSIALLRSIARDFDEAGIVYAIVGGVALSQYNYLRYTEDIDIRMRAWNFPRLQRLVQTGRYSFRPDSDHNLNYHLPSGSTIPPDILVEGDVAQRLVLPDPEPMRERRQGIWYVSLPKLLELKLARNSVKDRSDVCELTRINLLPYGLLDGSPFVEEYQTLWQQVQDMRTA